MGRPVHRKAAHWVDAFGASISFDQQMAKEDLEGSLAHVKMLGKTGIIPQADADTITAGLHHLQKNWQQANCILPLKMKIFISTWKPY